MPGLFDWAMALTGQEPNGNPYDQAGALSDQMQQRNRAAVGLDANGNPLPPGGAAPPVGGAATPAALATTGVMQPQQEPNATKTPPSMGHVLADLTQYQEREQAFNQGLGGMGAAISQPRDREWVRGLFNVNQVDPLKFTQQEMDMAGQQQSQDRMNSLGLSIQNPQTGQQIADALHMPGATPEARLAALQAAYRANPQAISQMISQTQQPTPQMANLDQITRYTDMVKQRDPGKSQQELDMIANAMKAGMAGADAEKAVGDAMAYQSSHKGQTAPWVTGNGVDINKYNQFVANQKTISDNQADAGSTFAGSTDKLNTLREKLANLKTDPDMARVLALPQDSLEKNAFQEALRDQNADWKAKIPQVLLIDPGAMRVLSDLKEATGQEYTNALDSILGHGLRPTAQEIAQVRAGYGQTPNILNFGSIKDYNAQAIDPMLTRMDQASAKAYGDSGQIEKAPDYIKPFINPIYLHGGKYHLDDGSDTPDWEKNVNKPMSPQDIQEAKAAIKQNRANAWHVVDAIRRKGYDTSSLAVIPEQ